MIVVAIHSSQLIPFSCIYGISPVLQHMKRRNRVSFVVSFHREDEERSGFGEWFSASASRAILHTYLSQPY